MGSLINSFIILKSNPLSCLNQLRIAFYLFIYFLPRGCRVARTLKDLFLLSKGLSWFLQNDFDRVLLLFSGVFFLLFNFCCWCYLGMLNRVFSLLWWIDVIQVWIRHFTVLTLMSFNFCVLCLLWWILVVDCSE